MKFTINKKQYTLQHTWNMVSLATAKRLVKITVTEDELTKCLSGEDIELHPFMVEAVACLSDCPKKVLEKTEPIHVVVLFDHVRYIVHGIYRMNIETFVPLGLTKYKHKGTTYHMPENLMLNGQFIPMHREPSKHVTEAGDVLQLVGELKEKGVEMMNVFCAIYMKETPDEFYDEKKIAKRSELFEDLPMHVVWDVFFCMYYSLCSYAISTKISLEKVGKAEQLKRNLIRGYYRWRSKVLPEASQKLNV